MPAPTVAPDVAAVNGVQPEIVVKAAGEGDRILLTVADTGPGIPEADRARAVERFVRLEQSRSQPGSGLGLSLAHAVARLHGGELRLEDNPPGLRSVLALPRGRVPPAVRPVEPSGSPVNRATVSRGTFRAVIWSENRFPCSRSLLLPAKLAISAPR